jgi:hypothetical protein
MLARNIPQYVLFLVVLVWFLIFCGGSGHILIMPLFPVPLPWPARLPQALPLHKLSITEKVVQAVQSMLLPQEGSLSIHTSLPATGDGSAPVMAVVRLLAEIRTR